MVQNFNYDGAGPDAFFWVGVEGSPDNVKNESSTAILAHPFQGKHYEYRNQDAPILGAASNEAVTLILPEHLKVSDVKIPGSSSLPSPIVPPSNDLKPEQEPESEPESEPSTKSEPEPEPKGAGVVLN